MTIRPGTTSNLKRHVLAGLAQVAILLLVFVSFLASNWGLGPGPWGGPGILAMSLAPIGWGLRQPWLIFAALASGMAGMVMNWVAPFTEPFASGGEWGHQDSLTSCLVMMLASTAVVAGQWVILSKLPMAGSLRQLRRFTFLLIAASLLFLLKMYVEAIIPRAPGWTGFYIENGAFLLFLVPPNLFLTAVILIEAFLSQEDD